MAVNLESIMESLKGGLISKGHSPELVEKAFQSGIYGRETPEGTKYENADMGKTQIGQYGGQGARSGMPNVQTYTAPPKPEEAPNILEGVDLSELRWNDPNQRDLYIKISDAQQYGGRDLGFQKGLLNKYNKVVMGKYGMFQGPDGSWLQKTREGIKPVIKAPEAGEIKAYKPGDYLTRDGQMIGQLPPLLTTETEKLLKRIDELPQGSPKRATLQARLNKLTKESEGAEKTAQNYLLPDKSIVSSFDGGRTYMGEGGTTTALPPNAVKVTATITAEDLRVFEAKKQAKKEIEEGQGLPEGRKEDIKNIARGGTGPYNALAAAIDNFFGGLGVDAIFGKDGFFQDTQKNRQVLRTIKQVGKAALLNSARGAIWEQQRIDALFPDPDTFFANPATEANKFSVLRETLLTERQFNNKAIQEAVTPKEIGDLRKNNIEIDRLLSLIGKKESPKSTVISKEDEALINKYLK